MSEQFKIKCLECDQSSYIPGDQAIHVVPEGFAKGEAFRAFCPFCDETKYVIAE